MLSPDDCIDGVARKGLHIVSDIRQEGIEAANSALNMQQEIRALIRKLSRVSKVPADLLPYRRGRSRNSRLDLPRIQSSRRAVDLATE